MTIQRLYEANGDRAGFWVQHRRWSNCCAQVEQVNGLSVGTLVMTPADAQSDHVRFRWFDVRSGRELHLEEIPPFSNDNFFATIATPAWARDAAAKQYH